jgi:hypothetical protein
MPYYVYAIHTDHTGNRLYEKFDAYDKAEKLEREMRAANFPHDNYRVDMFYAEDDEKAEAIAYGKRPHPRGKP